MNKPIKKLSDITEDDLKRVAQARKRKRLGKITFATVALPVFCAINFILADFILPQADVLPYKTILLVISAIGLLLFIRTLIKINRINWTVFLNSAEASILLQSTNVSFEKRMSQAMVSNSGINPAHIPVQSESFIASPATNELLVKK